MKKIPFSAKTIFKKNPLVKTITTKEGVIFSPLDNKHCIYYLEKDISYKIWKLIDGKKKLGKIKSSFRLYNKIKGWDKDFNKFIYDLLSKKLIIIKNK